MGYHERFDVTGFIHDLLDEDKKPDDGLLHPSGDINGCEIAMCHRFDPEIPRNPDNYEGLMRMMIGTFYHRWVEEKLASGEWDGWVFEVEVPVGDHLDDRGVMQHRGLPHGWAGTADVLAGRIDSGYRIDQPAPVWTLLDWKTIDGQAFRYKDFLAPDEDHLWQTSAYYWACDAMGYRMGPEICITYVPLTKAPKGFTGGPRDVWFEPLPKKQVFGRMKSRSQLLKRYLAGEHDLPQQYGKLQAQRTRGGVVEQILKPHYLIPFCKSTQCACAGQEVEVVAYVENTIPEVL